MPKDNSGFFIEKKTWSKIKDSLLACYLKPYIQKIIATRRPTTYIDCFAGKGLFEDGNPGSPIIALEVINDCLGSTNFSNASIDCAFIELNHADDLQKNLYKYKNSTVLSGKYEDNIETQIKDKKMHNVFLYIDPYGIKALNFSIFEKISQMNLNSIELLINMNSFGFIREACRTFGITFNIDVSDEIVEYEPTVLKQSTESVQDLNNIAGGDYWIEIIEDFKFKRINGYEAEKRFAEKYCERFMQIFKYVLNMPIRLEKGQRPKYRMIHATNHEAGCLLMNDNICKRWEAWQDIQSQGQLSFLTENIENEMFNDVEIQNDLRKYILNYDNFTNLNFFIAQFITNFGVRCSTKEIKEQLKGLEQKNIIEVKRTPETTGTGKLRTFWDCQKGKTIEIRSNKNNEKGKRVYN